MAYTALYREWRPKTFGEVVGQEHVTTTLKNQVKNNRIAHAYLMCGTRGTGKTTTAKILSKAVNCLNPQDGEPCNECEMCKKINAGIAIDVTELDAASNNSVDDIRNIIDDVQYPPHESKFKVYIIDEVHMLSQGAVNAFLKTLEEPPQNVVFILATTDPQKLPVTILSRCQRFDFKRIKRESMIGRLREIVNEKGVFADDRSLGVIARMSDGALRDAVSILDQAIAEGNGKVDYEKVLQMLGIVTNEYIFDLMDHVINKDIEGSIKIVDKIILQGKEITVFMKDFIAHVRNLMVVKVSKKPEEVIDMSEENLKTLKEQSSKIRIEETMRDINILQEAEEKARKSMNSRIYMEMAIIKMCKIEYDTSSEILLARINKLETIIREGKISVQKVEAKQKPSSSQKVPRLTVNKAEEHDEAKPEEEFSSDLNISLDDVRKIWRDVIEMFKSRRNMVMGVHLSNGVPFSCKDGVIEVRFTKEYNFSKQHLEKPQNNKKVEEVLQDMLHGRVRVIYSLEKGDGTTNQGSTEDILKKTFGEEELHIIDE
ncbi:DNA polymerase-3 subunit gamma/tau [Clostridium acetobutylicum]|uniref:DNA-directed DNA polymerase n=1 Tax=Clostridium acetobutylicum (strain ATCC 824 / DSM 792 / JCM 1419 / IAM 19013 / LMG 5710 / NBRC 13948 / NRRL B-527 / VKM B-1787 / 2291 / W) TaxID=272562 RepID=Q97MR6_CLOAB|nr:MULTISPECIES: DNA polymerase III subunit gamma/tau [Clostridium]AAK78110.1 DNA-directed DNA polymerase, III chain (dnaX) [Clostridium acetobutylicum ATCC 824]ADZ19169.1 DNA polymerase III subunits gamma and tau [Clostridium acetobutylicum EA 2018]AEI34723.1 DNA polymerase III subunits gamma and tau [Clostridium acetobutylicum DSM 1731]AWV81828.1 DNA polymerase III subunit gamma/tau [Clostridium acetobutylicum]MBC2395375.1 DNA polymerase III subunit gamma/tau [Clostridium acetobutylicum]